MVSRIQVATSVSLVIFGLGACTPNRGSPVLSSSDARKLQSIQERKHQVQDGKPALTSPETLLQVKTATENPQKFQGKAQIAVLYYLDQPAHRLAVLEWMKKNGARILFENPSFGYLDAELDWKDVGRLIATRGELGLNETSLMKLELEAEKPSTPKKSSSPTSENSSLFGPAHSAGYGAQVEEFRQKLASEFGVAPDHFEGQGSLVAVYDAGVDLTRTDVFGKRIKDFLVAQESNWNTVTLTLQEFMEKYQESTIPKGLENLEGEKSLRFVILDESKIGNDGVDLNGSGQARDSIAVAIYISQGHPYARFRIADTMAFGDEVADFGRSASLGKPQIIDLFTGLFYHRNALRPSTSAVGVKFRFDSQSQLQIAFVGTKEGSEHGIANLHMVGGDFTDEKSKVRYRGVAPQVGFLAMQTWDLGGLNYGEKWIPLARSILQAADAQADVIDLDIYTPGTRSGNDLLSSLLCRITATTYSVPIVAAHNYGPLPDTIQSLAQSPCALGIGASHTVAALKYLQNNGSIDPVLKTDDAVQTAHYSGRGFGMNGLYKPDILAPAYGYTAYGKNFIRFSGTSGATPTTAGIIALLKQAAREKGIQLGFNQIKFLLQASSKALDPTFARDGYGHVNLLAAWEVFKKYFLVSQSLASFDLSGQFRISYDGRPLNRIHALTLERTPLVGSVNTPLPMKFWVEYAGASAKIPASWLKFYYAPLGKPTPVLETDAPLHGESMRFSLYFDLDDPTWASLPPGDHIAIVKGVRKGLESGRNTDFLLPVSFTKGVAVEEAIFKLNPLYADQSQIISLTAKPGDHFILYGDAECLGKAIHRTDHMRTDDALNLSVDNEASYIHASDVMNSYAPMRLLNGAIRIVAKKEIVRLALVRRSLQLCEGAMGGQVIVRRTGFETKPATSQISWDAGTSTYTVQTSMQLAPTASTLMVNTSTRGGVEWAFKAGDPYYAVKRVLKGETSLILPEGVSSVRVVPNSNQPFQGILFETDPKGELVGDYVLTQNSYSAGMNSINSDGTYGYLGLDLENPKAGNTITFLPALNDSNAAVSEARIELSVALPDSSTLKLLSSKPITQWMPLELKTFSVRAHLGKPSQVTGFDSPDWNAELVLPFSIEERVPNSTDHVTYVPLKVWADKIRVPLPF